ncbi:hypothetical protein TNCV_4807241 [Trichonephila clavipes]|nr:hypothetical protein TNCV_4807241 [Trichonephila clavipes]
MACEKWLGRVNKNPPVRYPYPPCKFIGEPQVCVASAHYANTSREYLSSLMHGGEQNVRMGHCNLSKDTVYASIMPGGKTDVEPILKTALMTPRLFLLQLLDDFQPQRKQTETEK